MKYTTNKRNIPNYIHVYLKVYLSLIYFLEYMGFKEVCLGNIRYGYLTDEITLTVLPSLMYASSYRARSESIETGNLRDPPFKMACVFIYADNLSGLLLLIVFGDVVYSR